MSEEECTIENGNQKCRKVINFLVSSYAFSSVPYGTTCQDKTILKIFKETIHI